MEIGNTFRHHCVALVTARGRRWAARSVRGRNLGRYVTSGEAMSFLEKHALEEHLLGCSACAERAEQSAVWVDAIRSAARISEGPQKPK
jgi:hypothetical protein